MAVTGLAETVTHDPAWEPTGGARSGGPGPRLCAAERVW